LSMFLPQIDAWEGRRPADPYHSAEVQSHSCHDNWASIELGPTRDSAASAPWDTDSDRPADPPIRARDAGSGDASAGAKLRQGHDQRQQPLPVNLDEAQQLQPTAGRRCPHWKGGSSGTPSPPRKQYSAGAGPSAFTCFPRVLITPKLSMSMDPYSAVNSSQSRLPASATRRRIDHRSALP
jgi:hypothetical protein